MLTQLSVGNFVLVDKLELEFHPAMNVITGETGAGKSIILNALGLTLGERGSPSLIRNQKVRAEISAIFETEKLPQVRAWLEKRDLLRDNECILRRSLSGSGSKSFINGVPATLQDMKEVASLLISLQGQHAHQLLMRRYTHIRFIDDFGGTGKEADAYRAVYEKLLELRRELTTRRQTGQTDERMLSLLRHELAELEEIALSQKDYAELEEQHRLSNNSEILNQSLEDCMQILDSQDNSGLTQQLTELQSKLQQANDKFLSELANQLESGRNLLENLRTELQSYAEKANSETLNFADLDAKMSEIHRLARKHRAEPGDLESLKLSKQKELEELDSNEEKIGNLTRMEKETEERCRELAHSLTEKRRLAAARFDKEVAAKLRELDMECRFATQFSRLERLTENGDCVIEFMLATGPESLLLPMRRIASGGELSRIALAVNLVAARNSAIPCLVFDEVDSGISGGVASVVGKMLALLGGNTQVICITHHPQIAVHADAHYAVTKTKKENLTTSSIKILSTMERKTEIGRMIGGERLKNDVLDYAGKLIEQARPDVH